MTNEHKPMRSIDLSALQGIFFEELDNLMSLDMDASDEEVECENVYDGSVQDSCDNGFLCSVCGCKVEDEEHYRVGGVWNFCPGCGRRVVKP